MNDDRRFAAPQQSVVTPAKQRPEHLWRAGQSGNPKGRPLGARNKLGEAFIKALEADFEAHGVAAIVKVREEKPDQYLKVIASLMPKELNLNINDAESLTDDEIIARIRNLNEQLGLILDTGGIREPDQRAITPPAH